MFLDGCDLDCDGLCGTMFKIPRSLFQAFQKVKGTPDSGGDL